MNTTTQNPTSAPEGVTTHLGDVISDTSKQALTEINNTLARAPMWDRARWWYQANFVTAILAALALGVASGAAIHTAGRHRRKPR